MAALDDAELSARVALVKECGGIKPAARKLNLSAKAVRENMKTAAKRGLLGTKPVLEGFAISKISTTLDADGNTVREHIQQRPDLDKTPFNMPEGHTLKGVSALLDANGLVQAQWVKTREGDISDAWREALDEFKSELPRVHKSELPKHALDNLLAQYTVTDAHLGMLAWGEETRDADWDMGIAETLLLDWFAAAVEMAPPAHTAVFAQLGDLLHYDSMKSETPEHRHMLDADSRPQKMVRVVIRLIRRILGMLLAKHQIVHVIMAKANHDPYSSIWLREILAVMYEDEPRLTVDISPSEYYAYEFGETALFYHHGHRRNVKDVDSVFAGMFREMFGRCKHSYAHVGHLHNDEAKDSNLMKVERHRTLAPMDAYAANGGYLSKRDAKVIVYHKAHGEVSRLTLSPEMVQS